jgi:hypothetical protein
MPKLQFAKSFQKGGAPFWNVGRHRWGMSEFGTFARFISTWSPGASGELANGARLSAEGCHCQLSEPRRRLLSHYAHAISLKNNLRFSYLIVQLLDKVDMIWKWDERARQPKAASPRGAMLRYQVALLKPFRVMSGGRSQGRTSWLKRRGPFWRTAPQPPDTCWMMPVGEASPKANPTEGRQHQCGYLRFQAVDL